MASYTLEDKDFAFSIFRKYGELEATIREIKKHPRYKGINKTTIIYWSKKKDARGMDWHDRLKEIEVVKNEIQDKNFARDRIQTVKELDNIMDLLLKQIPESSIKSLEGAAKAYTLLAETKDKFEGTNIAREQLKNMAEAIFSALSIHPVVGPLIKQYWDEIKPQIEITFDKMNRKK